MKDDFKEAIFVATGITAPTRFLNCMSMEKKDNLSALLHLSLKDAEKIPNFGAACLEVLRQVQAKLRETGQSLYFSKDSEGKLPEDFNDCTHPHVPMLMAQLAQLCKRLSMIFRLEHQPDPDTWSIHLLNQGEGLVYATKDTSLSYAFELIFDYIGYQFVPVQLVLPSSR